MTDEEQMIVDAKYLLKKVLIRIEQRVKRHGNNILAMQKEIEKRWEKINND